MIDVKISDSFKKNTSKAILSIVLFIVVYILLLLFGIALTAFCVVVGFGMIVAKPMFITLGLGLGLASLGFLVLIFLFKFLFKKHKIDRSNWVEINKAQEPALFELIEKLVKEVDTDFPKKVYLSWEVNASVFYDSSFWSMFFPIKKNLHIGLGLVNSVTEEEFKAILAHEFGHFSQRSMKVGTYVYNVNQVIFNMLYDNESYDVLIQKWANISYFFSIFVIVAVKIIKGIQWVLQKMYNVVNLSYMALSREMEFHADEVAANVTGFLPLKDSLLRIELTGYAQESVLNFYRDKFSKNIKSKNIFQEQRFVTQFLANESELLTKNDLPVVTISNLNRFNKSKLNIKDQWASHPTIEERITALEKLNIVKDNPANRSAFALFKNQEQIEAKLTEKLFAQVTYNARPQEYDLEEFKKDYLDQNHKNSFGKIYNNYYNAHNPSLFDVELAEKQVVGIDAKECFSKEKVDMIYEYIALENDKSTIQAISNKDYPIKTFDYDGQKYNAVDGKKLIPEMEQASTSFKNKILENDMNIYAVFYKIAKEKGKETVLKDKYVHFFELDKSFEHKAALYSRLVEATTFISEQTPIDKIKEKFRILKPMELELKKVFKDIIYLDVMRDEIPAELNSHLENYLRKEWEYFDGKEYDNQALELLHHAINGYSYLLSNLYFLTKRDLLVFQSSLLD